MISSEKQSVLFCVATEKGATVLSSAMKFRQGRTFLVSTFTEKAVAHSYDEQIRNLARLHECELIPLKEYRSGLIDIVRNRSITAIVCIGWRYLVSHEVVHAVNGEVIVAHDSLLPRLRGFAPLPTALIAGERETGVTFLRAGTGVDDGDILWQDRVTIEDDDTIASLTEKVLPLYAEGIEQYLSGRLQQAAPQNHDLATYSLWRDEEDYRIDWSEDASTIERTVRALGKPYLGARCLLKDQIVIVHKTTVVPDIPFAIRQPGKVWCVDDLGRPEVVCGNGLLRIDDATIGGQSMLPLKAVRLRFA